MPPKGWKEGLFKKKVKRVWVNNGKDKELLVEVDNPIPDGWNKGRLNRS